MEATEGWKLSSSDFRDTAAMSDALGHVQDQRGRKRLRATTAL